MSQVFTSWKEIAAYLGKGVRTVQRWEVQLGLPIHRPNDRQKGIVRASRQELDEWTESRWSLRQGQAKPKPLVIRESSTVAKFRELRQERGHLVKELRGSVRALHGELSEMLESRRSARQPNTSGKGAKAS